jgi:phospholipid/cholesterol/gamma-HCH transport system substrate-binding protein
MDKSKAALSWTELRVGVVVLASLFILAFAILSIGGGGGRAFSPRYLVKALMNDVNGLKSGSPVRVGGVEVGTVTRVELAGEGSGMVEVTMRLERRVKDRVTTESQATLGSLGLLGEKAMDITSATHGEPVEDGGYLVAAAEDPLKGLLTDASSSTAHLRRILSRMDAGEGLIGKALRDEELYERMTDVSVRLQGVLGKLESDKGPLGRLVNDQEMSRGLADSVKAVERITTRVESGQGTLGALTKDDEFARDLKSLTSRLNEVAGRLQRGEGTAGKLLQDEALFRKLDGTLSHLDTMLARIERGEGTVGKLLRDDELHQNLNATLKDLHDLLAQVKSDPRRYLRVKLSLF